MSIEEKTRLWNLWYTCTYMPEVMEEYYKIRGEKKNRYNDRKRKQTAL